MVHINHDMPVLQSQNLEQIEHLATPQLRYVGLQPSDIESLRLPSDARLPLTGRDRSLLNSLCEKPFVTQNGHLHEQVRYNVI